MRKETFGVLMAVVFLASSCGKKTEPAGTPPPSQQAPASVPSPEQAADNPSPPPSQPAPEAKPFVIPPAAKKQAKYFPEGTPTRAIQDLDDMLDSYVLDPQTPEQKQYNNDLKRAVLGGTFDIRELCRLALDKHWGERTPQEQSNFVDLMTRLLEKKAIFSKEQGQKKKKSKAVYQVTYGGHRFLNPEETNSLAMSHVNVPSENMKIDLNYKLRKDGNAWKIYDIIVDGASLLDNYKYQFDKIIDKEGYPNLVHRMESKLKDIQAKENANTLESVEP